jgi:O-acetyl-ADP-ribose deacetylase (regulator of RNase III)
VSALAHLRHLSGDATQPVGDGPHVVAHVCNDAGRWGAGFSGAVSRRWPQPEHAYRTWHQAGATPDGVPFALGEIQVVAVSHGLKVANMVAQHATGRDRDGRPPIRYDALADALDTLAGWCVANGASVAAPRFGAGLAGGDWRHIETLVGRHLLARGVDVAIYTPRAG